jgi:hypothetical protein
MRAAKKRGRPTKYTPEMGRIICERLAGGESLRSICRAEDMPSRNTVAGWAADADHVFSRHYARARQVAYTLLADELIDIADDSTNDYVERQAENGRTYLTFNRENVERARLRVDARKWMLAKMLPKVYGDKTMIDHDGGDGFAAFLNAARAAQLAKLPNPHAEGSGNGA